MAKLSTILSEIKQEKDKTEFLSTGFENLDRTLDGGFLKKELVVLGGHTGFGKSYFAGQILEAVAKRGFKTAYFSLEISNRMVVSRLIGANAGIKPTRIAYGLLTKEEYDSKIKAETKLSAFEEYIDFYDDIYSLEEIVKLSKENAYEFIVVDFIQNLFVENIADEYTRLSKASLELQKFAKENNSCILVLSQLSNLVAREGSKGRIVEFKGSGNIATVADLGLFIERSEYEPETTRQDVKLILKKNRRGISGIEFNFYFLHPGGMIIEK